MWVLVNCQLLMVFCRAVGWLYGVLHCTICLLIRSTSRNSSADVQRICGTVCLRWLDWSSEINLWEFIRCCYLPWSFYFKRNMHEKNIQRALCLHLPFPTWRVERKRSHVVSVVQYVTERGSHTTRIVNKDLQGMLLG